MEESGSSEEWKRRKIIKKEKIYECGCGKRYKVYNSLESHIKGVHNGISPGPVKLPQKSNRGRPKQSQFKQFEQINESMANPLESLLLKLQSWKPSEANPKKLYESEPVYNLIIRFNDAREASELKWIEEDKIFQVSMGKGLMILLGELRTLIQPEERLNELILLITLYISYVIEETEDQNVLSNGSIGLLPEFVNFFLLHDYERRLERLRIKDLWIGSTANVIETFNIIFRWLIHRKFTYTKATVNPHFLEERKEKEKETIQHEPEQAEPDR